MADPTGEADRSALRLDFDRRLMLQFRGSTITSDAGLLAYRELDDTLHLTDTAANTLADARTGKNGRHRLAGLLRQSVFGRLAGYEDVNDASRIRRRSRWCSSWSMRRRKAGVGSMATTSCPSSFKVSGSPTGSKLLPIQRPLNPKPLPPEPPGHHQNSAIAH